MDSATNTQTLPEPYAPSLCDQLPTPAAAHPDNLLASLGDHYFAVDSRWRFTNFTALTRDDCLHLSITLPGKGLWDHWPHLLGTIFEARYRRAMEQQAALHFEHQTISGRWFEISAQPSLVGLRVYCREVTERHRAQRRVAVQNAISAILADASSLAQCSADLLQAICQCVSWDFAAVWTVKEQTDLLSCVETWSDPASNIQDFLAVTRNLTFRSGIGLPGRILASAAAAWIPDVTRDDNFPRAAAAAAVGLHSAFGFPVILEGEVLAVLEFFNHAIYEPDEDLLALMTAVGNQIGQFIRRKHAEAQLIEAKQIAEKANQAKDDFLATLSHELRTPLTPVLISLQSLENEKRLPDDIRDDMRMMRHNVEIEARLIDDLLDLTRIVRGKIQLHPGAVDIHALL